MIAVAFISAVKRGRLAQAEKTLPFALPEEYKQMRTQLEEWTRGIGATSVQRDISVSVGPSATLLMRCPCAK